MRRELSYKDTRELEALPARIEALETALGQLTSRMNDPAFYQQDGSAITSHNVEMAHAQAELDAAYARWEGCEAG